MAIKNKTMNETVNNREDAFKILENFINDEGCYPSKISKCLVDIFPELKKVNQEDIRKKAIDNLIIEIEDKNDSLNDDVKNALNFLLPQIKDEQKLRMINDIILDLGRVLRNEEIDGNRIEKEIEWLKEIGNGLIKKILNEI